MIKRNNLKSKNILYITHSYNNFIKFQVEKLAKNFNHVYVLVRHKPVAQLAKIIPVQEIKFHSLDYKIDLSTKSENITVIPTPVWYLPFDFMYSRLGPWHYRAVKKAVIKHNLKFDYIHAHFLWSAGYAGLMLSKEYNVPFVVTGHGQDVYKQPFKDKRRHDGIVKVLKEATEVITVSQNNLRIIKKLGVKRKVHVIPNGFNPEDYTSVDKMKLRDELGLPKDNKILLTVGNLEQVKGHDVLLNAILQIKETVQKKKLHFVWVGGGPLYSKLKKDITRLGLSDCITMTNFQPFSNVVKYELASDFFVLPSRNEGVPTVMFEAMAAGLPFISTKVGGIPEINREFSGILVESENATQLSEAILSAVNRKWDIDEIKEESKKYTWENICSRISRIYENL